MSNVYLRQELADAWQGKDAFAVTAELSGHVFREAPGRQTLQFTLAGRSYFVKRHQGVGWREICKNLLTLKLPIVSARTEWQAIMRLHEIGVPTMSVAGFGEVGSNPATRRSFLITDDLSPAISLETYTASWVMHRPSPRYRRLLIAALAAIARRMHTNGVCHRDFYLCHFLLRCRPDGSVDQSIEPQLSVIDLHRALLRSNVTQRWLIKDLAGLYFSSQQLGLSRSDLARFIKVYTGCSLREALHQRAGFWLKVRKKARQIDRRDWQKLLRPRLRALYRSSADTLRLQQFDRVALLARKFDSPAIRQFINDPDPHLDAARLLKDGDSTTVAAVQLDGKQLVVKRYNQRNVVYVIRRLFRPSRAWHCWRNAHLLRWGGIATPAPVLMLERRWGPLRRVAYFVTEHDAGADVLTLMQRDEGQAEAAIESGPSGQSAPNWQEITAAMRRLFLMMRRLRIVHGDLKASNLLYLPGQLQVIDLDAMRHERWGFRFRKFFVRDVNRFLANWRHVFEQQRVIQQLLGNSIKLDKAD